ncbi:NADPH-dependent glutamate synthase [uncultured Fusobacterium sp.]|uniref:NADPH-dependent glutamate synthase n=1 Tax=uncultured Fusobacterium sp. TaxID=159267 RepID=UPI0025950289|nr:NADPH-dependent glutamate synthase [uncultured Fusobacterium sp.]
MFEIVNKKWLTPIICYMEIEAPELANAAKPGQFLIVKADKKGERIPLTICDYNKEKGTVVIVFQVVGKGTKKIAKYEIGEHLQDLVGPLGQPSEFLNEDINKLKKEKYLFVAGGVGTAPIYPQIKWFYDNSIDVDVIIGSRNKEAIILIDEISKISKNLYLSTDDGSFGKKGKVTDVIDDLLKNRKKEYDHAVIIGPIMMMKFASQKCREYGIKNTVSLNPLMIDGTGMCGACRVTIDGNVKFACVDGPEFDGDKVDYDEALRRQNMYKTDIGRNILALEDGDTHHNDSCPIHDEIIDDSGRIPVREQHPTVRNKNFAEVSYGYNLEEAQKEARRCLNCKNPMCVSGCPVNINIPAFIQKIKEGDLESASKIIANYSSLPAICGRVCPQETQCEGKCILGIKGEAIAIGKLERFIGDWALEHEIPFEVKEKKDEKIAVIGSGPAGLTCAGELAKLGYKVTLFEALHKLGGVLSYGIPEFRLPKDDIVDREIHKLYELGVEVKTDTIVGRTVTVDQLIDNDRYCAVFIATGAGLPKFMNIPGENYNGVFSANEFLTRVNLMKANRADYDTPIKIGKRVFIVGGGNVAMDAARTAKRLGAETTVIYRRGEDELPARREEVVHAKEEGVNFEFLINPVEIMADENGWVKGVKCIKMELGEKDQSGRASVKEIPGSEFILDGETVIMALGTSPNPLIGETTKGLNINRRNGVDVDSNGQTSRAEIFAGGDAVTGAATVILAMEAGKKAALEIDKFLKNK